jgi:hypothetical protein
MLVCALSSDDPSRNGACGRCRLEAGELDRARELIEQFGFERGPLGDRLAALTSESASQQTA